MEGSHCRGSNIDTWLGLGLRVDLPRGLANKHQAAKTGRSINNKPAWNRNKPPHRCGVLDQAQFFSGWCIWVRRTI